MSRPLFSCVMPVKGPRPYMAAALESLRLQGMGDDLEVIVQDADVEPDAGQSDAFNKGFAKAHGEWLFWLNADDVLLPGALAAVREFIASGAAGAHPEWIAGNMKRIDDEGRVLSCLRGNGWHDWLYCHAVPFVNGPSAFFRRELFERIGGFDTSLAVCMDWDLWIRFKKAGARFRRLDRYVWGLRQWSGSKTQRQKSDAEESVHVAEVRRMLAKNGFRTTRWGTILIRLWRCLNGNYLLGWRDSCRAKRDRERPSVILVKHRAPYRDPVVAAVERRGGVRSFALFDNDRRHAWAGFARDGMALAGRWLALRLLREFVFSWKYAIVVWPAYHPWWLTLPILLSALTGRRYAVTADTKEENGGWLSCLVKRFIFRRAEFIWTPGGAARRYMETCMGVRAGNIAEGLFLVDSGEVARDCRSVRRPIRRFLMVGNDIPERRVDVLVEGFRRGHAAGQTLMVCGQGCGKYDGDGVEGCEGVPWSELVRLYAEADIYVHNGMEPYSTAVQIAAMRGLPIICSGSVGIVADFRGSEKPLITVDEWSSPEAWAAAFVRAQAMGEEALREMGARAQREAYEMYDVERMAADVWMRLRG